MCSVQVVKSIQIESATPMIHHLDSMPREQLRYHTSPTLLKALFYVIGNFIMSCSKRDCIEINLDKCENMVQQHYMIRK